MEGGRGQEKKTIQLSVEKEGFRGAAAPKKLLPDVILFTERFSIPDKAGLVLV